MSVSKGPGIRCGGRCPYGTPAARNFLAHRKHTVGSRTEGYGRCSAARAPSRWNFAELKVEGMPDSKVGSAKPEAKEADESFDLYLADIGLRVEGLWARDKPDYHALNVYQDGLP